MIHKADMIAFFDQRAATWDENQIRDDTIVAKILDYAGICAGIDVLDVACGTGVLFPDYLARGVRSVTGVDISPAMAAIAAKKFRETPIRVICADIEEVQLDCCFDAVVVYNAFPHFPEPERLVRRLAALTKPGGRMTIAHGMSRSKIDSCHSGEAKLVSNGLMSEDALQKLFQPYFEADVVLSDEQMYVVSGKKPGQT